MRTHLSSVKPAATPAAERIVVAKEADRAREFRRAYRHSRVVRVLRWALPVAAVAMFGSYGVSMRVSMRDDKGGVWSAKVPTFTDQNLTMNDPEYQGYNQDGSKFLVTAKTATQDFGNQSAPIALTGIEARLLNLDNALTIATSPRGLYNRDAGILDLFERVKVRSEAGMVVTMTRATLNQKEGTVVSGEPVLVEMPTGWVHGNAMSLNQKTKDIAFTAGVTAQLVPTPADEVGAKGEAASGGPLEKPVTVAAAGAPAGPRLLSASRAPIDITSERLDINDERKLAVFRGNVRASQADATLVSRELEVVYAGQAVGATPGAVPQASPAKPAGTAAAPQGQVKTIKAHQDVVLTRGSETAKAPEAEFNAETEKAQLTGGVLLTQGTDRQATADRADIDVKAETSRLTGTVVLTSGTDQRASADVADLDQKNDTALLTGAQVVVTQGPNMLRGQRLRIDRKAGTTEMTAPAAGRISARLIREQGPAAAPGAKPKAAPQAGGQPAQAGGPLSFKSDPKAPVDIDAERMLALDGKKTATFSGDVVAVQGGFTMRTPELVATYAGEVGLLRDPAAAAGPKAAKAAKDAKGETQLKRIRANKHVVLTTAENQEVIGDWADFDVPGNTVLIGMDDPTKNVGVRQGNSKINCTRLRVDTTTGEAQCESPPNEQVAQGPVVPKAPIVPYTVPSAIPTPGTANDAVTKKAIEAIQNGNCGGRPCAVFQINELRQRANAAAKKDPKAAAEIEAAAKQAAKTILEQPAVKRLVPKSTGSSWGTTTAPNEPAAPPSPPAAAKPQTN